MPTVTPRLAILLAAMFALTAAAPEPNRSPVLGTWELDLTRMPATYGPPPKRVVFTFRDIGRGEWRTTVDITAPNDSVRHSVVTYRPDGTAVNTEGDTLEADSAALLLAAPGTLVMNLAKDGRPGSVRVYTVSRDGRELTEAAANVDGNGAPFIRTFHFRRIG